MAAVRPAAVAGSFYPGNARVLADEVDDLLRGAEALAPRVGFPKVLIVPHAGYIYSGAVAAGAYDAVRPARGIVRRVVLLGPVHRVAVRGLAVTSDEAFATPLGSIPIDREALAALKDLPQVVTSDAAHALEHSLEVQLPFLQTTLGSFSLVPFAVGMASVVEVAQVIERLWGGLETHRRRDPLEDHQPRHRPRPRRSVWCDAAERPAFGCKEEEPFAEAARRLQFGRHRGRSRPRSGLLVVRPL